MPIIDDSLWGVIYLRSKTIKVYIKRSLMILPTLGLVGLIGIGMAMADSKKEFRSDNKIDSQGCHHDASHSADQKGDGLKSDNESATIIRHMTKVLDLTEAQEGAIKKIIIGQDEFTNEGEELLKNANVEMQIMELLTPEQVEQYQLMRKKMTKK